MSDDGSDITSDITSNFHGGDPVSTEAFERTPSERREFDRARIVRSIREDGPATCEELEDRLSKLHQSASARVSELRRAGLLVTVDRRPTRSMRSARVHDLAERAQ